MRILLVTEFFSNLQRPVFSGGVETRTYYTARYLVSSYEVVVFCRRRKGEKVQEKKGKLVVNRFGPAVEDSVATVPSLWARARFIGKCLVESRKIKADIVEGSNFVTLLPAFLIGLLQRKPKVAWYPDVLLGSWQRYFGPVLGSIGSLTEHLLVHLSWDRIITISQPVAEKLKKRGVAPAKISVVACGIEPDQLEKRFQKFSQPTLCVVSRLLSYKRVGDVIAALAILREEMPDLRLVIVGEGPEERKLRQQVGRLGLSGRVIFKNKVSQKELIRLIGRSNLLINPSLIEGFGIVLVEAAAAGTPFVAADIPALQDLTGQLQSGIVVERRNPKRIAEAIVELILNRRLYREKQRNGLRNAKQFTWESMGRQTEKVYQDLVRDEPSLGSVPNQL